MFSVGGVDQCQECNFPFLIMDDACAWWPLPLMGVMVAALLLLASFLGSWLRRRRLRKQAQLKSDVAARYSMLYRDLWDELEDVVAKHTLDLKRLGVNQEEVDRRVVDMRAQQSSRAGVSMRYLLSSEFDMLAQTRTSTMDPSFEEMKTSFWLPGTCWAWLRRLELRLTSLRGTQ